MRAIFFAVLLIATGNQGIKGQGRIVQNCKDGVYSELNLYVGLVGAAVVLLPFFFISFMFKIGKFTTSRYQISTVFIHNFPFIFKELFIQIPQLVHIIIMKFGRELVKSVDKRLTPNGKGNFIPNCFFCRPSDYTVSEVAVIEPWSV